MAGTEDTTRALMKLQKREPSEFAALMAATGAAAGLDPKLTGAQTALHWPALFRTDDPADAENILNAVHDVLAPFVRANAFAPPEALFRHAAGRGVHAAEPDTWAEIGLPAQAAYTCFMDTLGAVDTLRADAEKRRPRKAAPATPDDGRIPIEDSILVAGGAATDRTSYAEERKVTITPGTGDVPGRTTLPRPAVPGTPIGEENTQRTPSFFPGLPSQDRGGHGDPGPAAPTVPPPASTLPGGAPDLGHGFDPTVPFNETGAPPAGQAPAPAEETIGASTAIAEAPAAPKPAPDAPADLPKREDDDATEAETVQAGDTENRAGLGNAPVVATGPAQREADAPMAAEAAAERLTRDAQEANGAEQVPGPVDAGGRRDGVDQQRAEVAGDADGTEAGHQELDRAPASDARGASGLGAAKAPLDPAQQRAPEKAPDAGPERDPVLDRETRGPTIAGTQDGEHGPGTVADTEDEPEAERQADTAKRPRKGS